MAAKLKPFSTFANYELKPMVVSPAVKSEAGEMKCAENIEKELRPKLLPLIEKWDGASTPGRIGTFIIELHRTLVNIVGVVARLFAVQVPGESRFDMELV